MLTQIENSKGIISYDNSLMEQLIADSLRPYHGSYKLIKKSWAMKPEGVEVELVCHLKFGTSISGFSYDVMHYLAEMIESHLELTVYRIALSIPAIYSKKTVQRKLNFELNNKFEITHH
ncbi:MAG: hypothetical protein IKZ78_03205 [Firmicutes bacterium]|nr:hypothetical protein [Bacillota bacterium]MBR6025571.1 hypothetical protein [Bacillota bacterium]